MGEDAGKGAGEVEHRRRNVPGRKEGRRKWERAKEAAPGWGEGMVELQPPQEKVVAAPMSAVLAEVERGEYEPGGAESVGNSQLIEATGDYEPYEVLSVKLHLPIPHDKQKSVMRSKAKRKVIVAGRRGGKTTLAAMVSATSMVEGKRVLYAAPSEDQTDNYWASVVRYCAPLLNGGFAKKNETKRMIRFINDGSIRAKTAWNADLLRGDFADLLILDEFSVMQSDVWTQVGAPMLLDNNGDAIFIFTPKRKNHAYRIYNQARGEENNERWQAWHFTSYDNPHLSKEALEEIIQDMTDEDYQQEIMAEFLESQGQVFRNIDACMNAIKGDVPENHAGHWLVAGVDWGRKKDFTVISIGCAQCRREVYLDRFNQIDYDFQTQRLREAYHRWGVKSSLGELNAMGEPLVNALQKMGVAIVGFQTTPGSKGPLIKNLALSLERGDFQFIDDPVARAELEAYESVTSANTGWVTYSAPSGMHDDTVIARALMVRAMQSAPVIAQPIKQSRSPLTYVSNLFG